MMKSFDVFNEQVFFYVNKKFGTCGTLTNNPKGMPSEQAIATLLGVEPGDIEIIAVVSEMYLTKEVKKLLTEKAAKAAKGLL